MSTLSRREFLRLGSLAAGATLLAAAVASFEAESLRRATLWVFEANAAARGFYAHSGWKPTHARRVEPEFGEPEIQLMRTVGGSNRSPDHRASAGWRELQRLLEFAEVVRERAAAKGWAKKWPKLRLEL